MTTEQTESSDIIEKLRARSKNANVVSKSEAYKRMVLAFGADPNKTTEENLVEALCKRNALECETEALREELRAERSALGLLERGLVAVLSDMVDSSITFEYQHPSLASSTVQISLDPNNPSELQFDVDFKPIEE